MSNTSRVSSRIAGDNAIVALLADLRTDPPTAAQALLGAEVTARDVSGAVVVVRIVEVEAYGSDPGGPWPDRAAHTYPGVTPRNAAMFGPPGHLYVYRSYGIHLCGNVTCGADGVGGGVLLRAGEVVDGVDVARRRRPTCRTDAALGRGPGNMGTVLDLHPDDYGSDLLSPDSRVGLTPARLAPPISSGPRVGVRLEPDRRWRFWITDSPAVSVYRRSPRAAPAHGDS